MTKYRPKGNEVTAVKYTGNNIATVQNFVGEKKIDLNGKVTIENFAAAEDWVVGAVEGQYALNTVYGWTIVEKNSWIVKQGTTFMVLDDASFQAQFEEVPA